MLAAPVTPVLDLRRTPAAAYHQTHGLLAQLCSDPVIPTTALALTLNVQRAEAREAEVWGSTRTRLAADARLPASDNFNVARRLRSELPSSAAARTPSSPRGPSVLTW
ncbi:hypothetical protein GCM10008955_39530 [Deinococcus malanensis]|uniref:Uncharacterized protein n=1 Tax=Deinococcus malanensis TaxID=1706855 RepID=A0ABQ2F253_9DEIO|nr:hypothetical protein [Deinococcus malanensis]GGK41821.1 hypothetical protein GCM10008955_39530 [Deinococcus malanensis]